MRLSSETRKPKLDGNKCYKFSIPAFVKCDIPYLQPQVVFFCFVYCSQAIYASRDNSTGLIPHENSDSANLLQNWTPSCFICLSEIKDDLRVLLPCRHAGICLECFKEFRERTAIRSHNPLSGLICPLCRTTITAILRMDSHQDSESANTGNIQLQ